MIGSRLNNRFHSEGSFRAPWNEDLPRCCNGNTRHPTNNGHQISPRAISIRIPRVLCVMSTWQVERGQIQADFPYKNYAQVPFLLIYWVKGHATGKKKCLPSQSMNPVTASRLATTTTPSRPHPEVCASPGELGVGGVANGCSSHLAFFLHTAMINTTVVAT